MLPSLGYISLLSLSLSSPSDNSDSVRTVNGAKHLLRSTPPRGVLQRRRNPDSQPEAHHRFLTGIAVLATTIFTDAILLSPLPLSSPCNLPSLSLSSPHKLDSTNSALPIPTPPTCRSGCQDFRKWRKLNRKKEREERRGRCLGKRKID
ncbi:hypothetical protein TIFTF001_038086 [Ficus carica]|uniref:Uncharacterized protein n=1 Tax=Ficus carica TaxID=3494 RepID=A0AA88JCH6_FICCA|nr:hypothetical protein TIFTF001_038080 [Ficus carica]GMN69034.1 hypothetical protein TIFTF001_038086 [Ficus carica]